MLTIITTIALLAGAIDKNTGHTFPMHGETRTEFCYEVLDNEDTGSGDQELIDACKEYNRLEEIL